MKKILVIGSANADLTIYADRVPSLGETITGRNFCVNAGGKGSNQAIAVAKLGGNVSFIGCVGNDSYGKMLIDNLNDNNIEFKGLVTDKATTGIASITVVNGDNFIILDQGANALLTSESICEREDVIKDSDYVVLQCEVTAETVYKSAELAKINGKTVVYNPAPYRAMSDDFYSFVDILIPNEHEAQLLTGIELKNEDACKKAVYEILKKGVKTVIITLGSKGCVYNEGDEVFFHPAIKVKAVDTTSAGDSFIGALVTRLSHNESLKSAIEYATKVSSITVTRYGASSSIPYEYEV